MIINETPVRTPKNFNINNIKIENIYLSKKMEKFSNINIIGKDTKVKIDNNIDSYNLTYGIDKKLEEQVKKYANANIKMTIDSKTDRELQIQFKFDKDNKKLLENIEIIANPDTKETVILKYKTEEDEKYFHNGIIRATAKENSILNIVIVNFMNIKSNNFMNLENQIEKNAKIKYTIVDFGGKNSITNYYSNLKGESSENALNSIYLGKEHQLFDLNYIGEVKGEKSNINIEVQGALTGTSKKNFKGTINFKKGCKKSKGNENEACVLLSDKAKSIALPMLLCSEEDVEGNHSTSSGKVGERELFYIMSRGFTEKEAIKLIVRAKFNKILETIKNKDLTDEILSEIDKKME